MQELCGRRRLGMRNDGTPDPGLSIVHRADIEFRHYVDLWLALRSL